MSDTARCTPSAPCYDPLCPWPSCNAPADETPPIDAYETGERAELEREPTSWAPVDLAAALDGEDIEPPALLRSADNRLGLLYRGRTHTFSGEPESCKTWAALLAAVQVLDTAGRVLWVDFEDDDRGVVSRLRALGANTDTVRERFIYIHPEEPLHARDGRATAAAVDFAELLDGQAFDLAVIDGITEAMVTENLDPMSNADVANWMRRVPKRIAAAGAATVGLDHLTKSRENQGRYAIGAQHKLAGITGAAYKFEVRRPLARAVHDPVEGSVLITVTKDRPGHVRGSADSDGRVCVLELTAWPDSTVSGALTDPGSTGPDLRLMKAIAEYLAVYDSATQRRIEDSVQGTAANIRTALRWMADPHRGWISVSPGPNRSHLHSLTPTGRAELAVTDT